MMDKPKIGLFDMDGTLFDYEGQLRRDYRQLMSPGEEEPADIFTNVGFVKARIDLITSTPGWWRNLPRFQLGWTVLDLATKMGFETHILTKGPRVRKRLRAWTEKVQCIYRHCSPHVHPNIVGKTKMHSYGAFLVDDYPDYIKDWLTYRKRGLVIMPAHPYNADFEHSQVVRYDGTNICQVTDALIAVRDRRPGQALVLPWQQSTL